LNINLELITQIGRLLLHFGILKHISYRLLANTSRIAKRIS
jgi:hypothetical protein